MPERTPDPWGLDQSMDYWIGLLQISIHASLKTPTERPFGRVDIALCKTEPMVRVTVSV
ncbi:MAG: hypothetical protein QNL05_03565 [Gammaproteobacteria bacterium]|nr:hypothetical protein [Gammaproteobacteria bacterium]